MSSPEELRSRFKAFRGTFDYSSHKPVEYGGGGGDNGTMEARVAVLEQIVKEIRASLDRIEKRFDRLDARLDKVDERHHQDFRLLFKTIIALALGLGGLLLGLLGVVAHGFKWL